MTRAAEARYEPVIGLEVHTHLRTDSKLFSPAPVRYGDPPNHDVHPIDLGMPGVLPVLNARVVELAIRLGIALHAKVNTHSIFARKNYFYPDLPKGYQISQYEEPVVSDGWLEIQVDEGSDGQTSDGESSLRRIGITRAHLEEDAGKSIHDDVVTGREGTHVDLNRAGVPLLEIVSEPDLRSAVEASAYLKTLRSILRYIGVSEADMEKGQFRCDANVSIRPVGSPEFGTRTELKNLNSFRFVEEAIDAEIERQSEVLDAGGEIIQATLSFDPVRQTTRVLREKENADDYRYFADPDLIPLVISEEQIAAVEESMPELPEARTARFRNEYGLSDYDARLLTSSLALADFFERTVAVGGGEGSKSVANWILRDLLQALKEREIELENSAMTPESLASLVRLVDEGRLTVRSAREIFPELVEAGADPESLMQERGLEAVSNSDELEAAVDEAIDSNPKAAESYRAGDAKSLNFLMGQVMKKTQGKADPAVVRGLLSTKLGG